MLVPQATTLKKSILKSLFTPLFILDLLVYSRYDFCMLYEPEGNLLEESKRRYMSQHLGLAQEQREAIIANLEKQEPVAGVEHLVNLIEQTYRIEGKVQGGRYKIMDLYVLLETFAKKHDLGNLGDINFDSSNGIANNIARMNNIAVNFISELRENQFVNEYKSKQSFYQSQLGVSFSYEFTEGDLEHIQNLINELRDILTNSDCFSANHKERVLKKLESLQGELHKKMSSLDKFWGLMGEAGVAMGKLGEDAKPFVDRVVGIVNAAWRVQANAEQLQSGLKMPLLAEPKPDALPDNPTDIAT